MYIDGDGPVVQMGGGGWEGYKRQCIRECILDGVLAI